MSDSENSLSHHLIGDLVSVSVVMFVQFIDKQPILGIFEQHIVPSKLNSRTALAPSRYDK